MKNQRNKLFFVLVGLTVLFMNPVFSQENVSDSLLLDEVVVTATKTMRNVREVPSSISVIRARDIEFSPAMQVDDVLRFVPGLNVNRTTGIYSQRPMITLRGLSGDEQSRTLVLLNGVPVNTSDEGGVNWNRINQFDIEQIEIFKGPNSSLYGNNAMGGVINIITRKPSRPQEIYGAVTYGTFNTIRQDLNLRVRSDKGFYGSVSQYFLKSDGYNNVPEDKRTTYDIARSLEEVSVSAKAGYDGSTWLKWELQYDIFRDQRGEGYQIYNPEGCYRNFHTDLFRGTLKGGENNTHYDVNLYYQLEHYYDINERMKNNNYSRYDVNSFRKDMGVLLNVRLQLLPTNVITGGVEVKRGSIEGGDYYLTAPYDTVYNEGILTTYAGYIQEEQAFLENKIRLIAGLRFDHVSFSDGYYYTTTPWNTDGPEMKDNAWSSFSPRLGMRFNPVKEISAYLSYSHGFRASILDDLTRTGWMWVGPKYANPELGPESINNFEAGVDVFPVTGMKISTSAYYSLGADFLYYVATTDSIFGRPIYIRKNVTNVTIKGIECEVSYEPVTGLRFLATYAFNDSKIDKFTERPDLENKYLKYAPKHTASASILWSNKIVNTGLRCFYKGEQFSDDANSQELDPYFTFDLHLSKEIIGKLLVSLDIQNIFDRRNMETADYLSPGRLINGRIAFTF